MAEVIFNNAEVILGTSTAMMSTTTATSTTTNAAPYDISVFVKRVKLQRQFDLHDDTRMGHTAHSRIAGLEDWTAELELLQDFQIGSILTNNAGGGLPTSLDKLIASILGVRAQLAIRPILGARSSDNPEFNGAVMLESYSPMDGAVGDLLSITIPFRSAGNLARITCSS
jgi:hypothetical protein